MIRQDDDIKLLVNEIVTAHLKRFRPAKGADNKELYQKRLAAFVEELLEALK